MSHSGLSRRRWTFAAITVLVYLTVSSAFAFMAPGPQFKADGTVDVASSQKSWGVELLTSNAASSVPTTNAVRVAIIDTGIDFEHPALAARVKGGISTTSYTSGYEDDNGHGTHIAGVIAAGPPDGLSGIAPTAELYVVKALDARAKGSAADIAEGIEWAVSRKCDVINLSLSTANPDVRLEAACRRALEAGVVIVAAAGNAGPGDGTVRFPATLPGVIAVTAVDRANRVYRKSGRGIEVDVSAPGVNIYSTWRDGRHKTMTGTSMAAAHVTGVVAQLLAKPVGDSDDDRDGRWDPAEVQARLERDAKDLGVAGFDTVYGAGLVTRAR